MDKTTAILRFFLYGQNDTFLHGLNDKNSPVLIDTFDSISNKCFIKPVGDYFRK